MYCSVIVIVNKGIGEKMESTLLLVPYSKVFVIHEIFYSIHQRILKSNV